MRTRRLIRVTMIVIVHELHCPRLPTIAVMHATYHTLRIGHHSLAFWLHPRGSSMLVSR